MSASNNSVKPKGRHVALARAKPRGLDELVFNDYRLVKTIGLGRFSQVMLGEHVKTGEKVAVKIIHKDNFDSQYLENFFREARIMKSLNHPNILKLIKVIKSRLFIFLVIEYASGGDLGTYLQEHGRLSEWKAREMLRQIVSAVEYCHRNNIVHRDLKPENILLDAEMNIKVADFGLSAEFAAEKKLDRLCGSLSYMAPEFFRGDKYGFEVDAWAIGILLYVLLTVKFPFYGSSMEEFKSQVLRCSYKLPDFLSSSCKNLLKKILILDSVSRPNLKDIMQDTWLNHGYSSVLQPYVDP